MLDIQSQGEPWKYFKKSFRLCLGTPSLSYAISDIKHVLHEYNLTDHATSYFTIDFAPNNKGPGVFRAHPSLLKNNDYKNLIDNSIMRTLLEDLKDKNGQFFIQNMAKLQKKGKFGKRN